LAGGQKLNDQENEMKDYTIIKDHIREYGDHFAKIIKISKVKYIIMYFNNEQDLLFKATYDSEDLGKGLQIKAQDEIIGKDGSFKKPGYRMTSNIIAHPPSEDEQFEDAVMSPTVSTVSNNEVVEKFSQLNSDFSNRINEIKVNTIKGKEKEKGVESEIKN
jgi:hypothetical protein